MRRHLVVAGLLAVLPCVSVASEGVFIPPGQEAKVQALLAPVAFQKPLADGWLLTGIAIERDLVKLAFTGPDATAEVTLHHPASGVAGERMGHVLVGGEAPPPVLDALRASLSVKSLDQLPWVRAAPGSKTVKGGKNAPSVPEVGRTLMHLALALLASLVAWFAFKYLRRVGWRDWLPIVGATAMGLVLRLMYSPRAFLHEYYHAGDHIQGYLFRAPGHPFFYGETGPTIYMLANAALGGDEQAVFTANIVLSVLTIPVVAAFDYALFKRWGRAAFAAALFALLPLNLRFAASEDLSNPAVLFGTLALTFGVLFLKRGGWLAAIGAALATALTMHSRPELMVWPFAVVAVSLAASRVSDWKRLVSLPGMFAGVILLVLCGAQALYLLSLPHEQTFIGIVRSSGLVAFLDSMAVPPFLVLVAAAGFLWGVRRRPVLVVALLAVALGMIHLTLSFFVNPPPYNLRTQMIVLPVLLVLCACVVPLLGELSRNRPMAGRLATVGLLAATLVWSMTSFPWVEHKADAQQEWDFLADAVPKLPKAAGVLLTVVDGKGARISTFPTHLLEREKSLLVPQPLPAVDDPEADWPAADGSAVFYQGMYCYSYFSDEPPAAPLTPRCAAIHERYELEPIVTREIPGPGYSPMSYAPPPYLLGFYRLTGLRETPAPTAAVPAEAAP